MRGFYLTCVALSLCFCAYSGVRSQAQEAAVWNAFASAEASPPAVEGKKNRDRKHPDDIEPTPAPAPDPDAKPEPIPKRPDSKPHVVKPAKPEKPDHSKPDGGHHNGDKTIDKTVTNVVYRSSWTPSAYDLILFVVAGLSLMISIACARRSGVPLTLSLLWTFWK